MKKFTQLLILSVLIFTGFAFAQNKLEVSTGADFVSRYVWRGMDFGNSPAVQPGLSISSGGFEAGVWGSFTLDANASGADELDSYISYSFDINKISVSAIVTDYYFPNAGVEFSNFNNHDDEEGAGAHTFEAGVTLSIEDFPVSFSAFYNFYNDAGNNTYFQLDMPFTVKDYELNLFAGATAGSEENPGYYGTDEFAIINIGITASREIKVTDSFSIPVFVGYSINPELDQSYLVFGMSF